MQKLHEPIMAPIKMSSPMVTKLERGPARDAGRVYKDKMARSSIIKLKAINRM